MALRVETEIEQLIAMVRATPNKVTTRIFRMPMHGDWNDLEINFANLSGDEARRLIELSLEIARERTNTSATPDTSSNGNRFSGLDL